MGSRLDTFTYLPDRLRAQAQSQTRLLSHGQTGDLGLTLLFSASLGLRFTKLAVENLEPTQPEVQARTSGAELAVCPGETTP